MILRTLLITGLVILGGCSDNSFEHELICNQRIESERNEWSLTQSSISQAYHYCTFDLARERNEKRNNKKLIGCNEFRNHLSSRGEKLSDSSWEFCKRYEPTIMGSFK